MEKAEQNNVDELTGTVWLTPKTAEFSRKNGLLYLFHSEILQRVTLCRQFPFDSPFEFISVMNEDSEEIGMIRSIELFDGETRELLKTELERRYYAPKIQKILSVKERFGFSYWKVETEQGELKFTLKDSLHSIFTVNRNRIIFSDVDGNRFEIRDLSQLDEKSRKKMDLYL